MLALAEFGEVVRVQPELRSRAIADRFYNAVKSTPYAHQRLIVQAVHGTEIRHYCKDFTKLTQNQCKVNKATRAAINCIYKGPLLCIPENVCIYWRAGVTLIGSKADVLENFCSFQQTHLHGRLCAKRFKGGDIGLIYQVTVTWRSVYRKTLHRVKTAAVFTFSHLTLNKTSRGYEVRLPDNHRLNRDFEARLRLIALSYSELFDDVLLEDDDDTGVADAEAEPETHLQGQVADDILAGKGDWAAEM